MGRETRDPSRTRLSNVEVFVDDAVTYLRFFGPIAEDFSGASLADHAQSKFVVLQLADITRITSFGIREWMSFMKALSEKADEVVLVECTPKIVDQINMVAGFTGIGQVFSFFAPYRCDYCDEDNKVILQLDRDWEVIKTMHPPDLPCGTCGEMQEFDEDPITYFSSIIKQGPIQIPVEVSALLSSPTKYRPSVIELGRRLQIDKLVHGNFTHLYLSGDLNGTFPRAKLADGLEGVVVIDLSDMGKLDPAGAAEWRTFLQMIAPGTDAVLVTGMPQTFMEKLGNVADSGSKGQLLSFSFLYTCTRCALTAPYLIEIEAHHQHLRVGTVPPMPCRDCKADTRCAASQFAMQRLSLLPKPVLSPPVREFVETVRGRKPVLDTRESGVVVSKRRRSGGAPIALLAVATFIAVAAASVAGYLYVKRSDTTVVEAGSIGKQVASSADQRPQWITSDTPLSAECQADAAKQLTCLGLSSLQEDLEEAGRQAREAALEAGMRSLGLMIDDEDWSAHVGAAYRRIRQSKHSEFFNEDLRDPGSMRSKRSMETLINGRRAVVSALAKTFGDEIDVAKPDAEYWERYLSPGRKKERYLAFVQYQISGDIVERMSKSFSAGQEALDARVVTSFPGLAWRYPTLEAGVVVVDTDDGVMKEAGIQEGQVITAIQGRPIKDSGAFVQFLDYQLKSLAQESGDLRLTVLGDKGSKEVRIPASLFDTGGSIIE